MQKCEEGKGAASNEQRQFCSKGGKGEKGTPKNVVKSCKYIIHLCQKKG